MDVLQFKKNATQKKSFLYIYYFFICYLLFTSNVWLWCSFCGVGRARIATDGARDMFGWDTFHIYESIKGKGMGIWEMTTINRK